MKYLQADSILFRRRNSSGDGRGLQNRQRGCESRLGWVRPPHASANLIQDFEVWVENSRGGAASSAIMSTLALDAAGNADNKHFFDEVRRNICIIQNRKTREAKYA
ncbi:MAG TPA: hypothetical protein DEA22_05420 [Blastocatellia bacterium]|nr:hypothetical protein [Blastocatellia bacterium]